MSVPITSNTPHTVESLLRVVQARDAEVALLKLMVEKLKVQLLRRTRAQLGASSERLDGPQLALIEGRPLDELAAQRRLRRTTRPTRRRVIASFPGICRGMRECIDP